MSILIVALQNFHVLKCIGNDTLFAYAVNEITSRLPGKQPALTPCVIHYHSEAFQNGKD